MRRIVQVESSYNPLAIGVVDKISKQAQFIFCVDEQGVSKRLYGPTTTSSHDDNHHDCHHHVYVDKECKHNKNGEQYRGASVVKHPEYESDAKYSWQ